MKTKQTKNDVGHSFVVMGDKVDFNLSNPLWSWLSYRIEVSFT